MKQKKVLIVSGDPILLELLQKNLADSGYQVVSVEEDSKELNSMLKVDAPDMVIVDIMMPKMEGIKISLSIRKKYDVPVIMLSTYSAGKEKVRGLDMGAKDALSNSVDILELMDWIKEAFSRNHACGYHSSDSNGNGRMENS